MKTCPVCSTTYDARVDFCFRDGEVLVDAPAGPAGLPPEDEFDQPLPATSAAAAPDPTELPSAADLPQPRFLSSATDLPEPAFLQRETVAETAPFPTTPAPPQRAPIPDDETLPMPLDGGVLEPPAALAPLPPPMAPPVAPAAAPPPAPQPAPEPVAFVPPAEPAFTPEPAPLPPVQPAAEPELDAWATPEPPPRIDEEEGGGGPPWAIIALVALLLIGVGGYFAWRSSQGPTDGPIASLDPDLGDPASMGPDAGTPTKNPQADPAGSAVDPEPPVTPDPVLEADPETDPGASTDPSTPDVAPKDGPDTPAVTPPTPVDTPDPEPRTDPVAEAAPWDAPEPEDQPENGTIKVSSSPAGATLFLDGRRVGTAPMSIETTQGRHKVRAEAEGYKTQEIMVSLNSNLANANLTLQRDVQTQQVMLYGPAGAKNVRVAGQTINALPATISLPVGRHVFTVTQADGTSFQVSQSIAEGAQANVMLLPPE